MTEDLFGNNNNENKNYFEELVGEGKKFKTPEDLAKGKAASDAYIKTLEEKLDELRADNSRQRDEINAGLSLKDLLDQIGESNSRGEPTQPARTVTQPQTPAVDLKQLEDLVASRLQAHEATKQQEANAQVVLEKLREHYGDSYQNTLKQQMDELGIDENVARTWVRNHPKAFLKALGIDGPKARGESFQTPPRSTTGFAPQGTPKRTWSYYQEIKKKDPDAYYSPKITAQRHADAIALGDAFKDGDWQD